jgi:hypothetical protein
MTLRSELTSRRYGSLRQKPIWQCQRVRLRPSIAAVRVENMPLTFCRLASHGSNPAISKGSYARP